MIFRQMFKEKYMRFPEGRAKAVTFSYDDGVKADKKLLKIFEKYALKGTFNLNSQLFDCANWHDRMDEEQTAETFADCGQEIAVHGARHVFLNKVSLPEAASEILSCRAYLEEKFGRIVTGMAYAYNGYNEEIKSLLKTLGISYARTTTPTYDFGIPSDFLEWHPTCHHADARLNELAEAFIKKSPLDEFKNREPWLLYVWGHSYEFDDHDNWQIIEKLAHSLSGRGDIWFATNGEICAYTEAYRKLVFSVDGERVFNPSALDVWLEIRGETYKVPAGGCVRFTPCAQYEE